MNIREWTLPIYTILTQLASGALFVLWVIRTLSIPQYGRQEVDRIMRIPVFIILVTILGGITGAHFHLSRPFLSFLALANFRTSWLSRELVFNLFFIFSEGCLCILYWSSFGNKKYITFLGWVAIFFGFATDFCMSRIYMLPSQPAWNSPFTIISFVQTTFLLGVMAVPVLLIMDSIFSKSRLQDNQVIRARTIRASFDALAVIAFLLVITIVVVNLFQISNLRYGNESARTAMKLLVVLYQPLFIIRIVFLFVGVLWLGITVFLWNSRMREPERLMTPVFIACLMVMVAEILGRFLFYAVHVRVGI
jgi:anaerobic dimethyl sulfoxide reductase subunit C (anchor subunit)